MTATTTSATSNPPARRKWSRKDLKFLIDAGAFAPDERLELIEGDLIEKMAQNSPHAAGISAAEDALRPLIPAGHYIRVQLPLAVSEFSQADPDVAVVKGSFRDYERDHPTPAVLVIEIADSSLSYDRTVKAGLYARAEVPECWIVNLNDRLLEVHRQPAALSGEPGGRRYLSIERYGESQMVAPLLAPNAKIRVSDLLPAAQPVS